MKRLLVFALVLLSAAATYAQAPTLADALAAAERNRATRAAEMQASPVYKNLKDAEALVQYLRAQLAAEQAKKAEAK